MVEVEIPTFGLVRAEHLVLDFTGTLAVDGKLLPGVKELLNDAARLLKVHVITADTFGKAPAELKEVDCVLQVFSGDDTGVQKERYVKGLGGKRVIAIGNGNNDRKMLKAARIGIIVMGEEGCSVHALMNADILIGSIRDALGLFLNPMRLKATLRF